MIQVENEQVEEPELIYDGENTLIKIGSDRYNTFLNLLQNNNEKYNYKKPRHHICLTCWQFVGVLQKAKHDSLLHKTIDAS